MAMTFVSAIEGEYRTRPGFTVFYEGGYLELEMYEALRVNGEVVFQGQDYDPWFEHDRRFIDAVQRGDPSVLANDYHDGLYTLAPVLAGWESAAKGGATIAVEEWMWL